MSAPLRVDQQAAELCDIRIIRVSHDKDASDALAIQFRDPETLARRVVLCRETREQRGNECLELLVEVELTRVELTVGRDCPSDVAGARSTDGDDGRSSGSRVSQQLFHARHRGDETLLTGLPKAFEHFGCPLLRPGVQVLKCAPID